METKTNRLLPSFLMSPKAMSIALFIVLAMTAQAQKAPADEPQMPSSDPVPTASLAQGESSAQSVAAPQSASPAQPEASQEEKSSLPDWIRNIKFSGYGMLQYQFEDPEGGSHNEFNLRLMRMSLTGKIGDFTWFTQIQGSLGTGPGTSTFSLMDLNVEWGRFKEFRVKVGQFKRAFSFETYMHPITQGWYSYSLAVNNLVGYGDRTGEKSSGGRDIGIQIQGDLFPMPCGQRLLHYQVGVFNGEGINFKDKDRKKDIMGGLWFVPIPGLRVGASAWTGTRGEMVMTRLDGTTETLYSVRKNRYAISADYQKNEWSFAAEYIHSQGWGTQELLGDKADGWYVYGIVPVLKGRLHAKARYQCYRDNKKWDRSKSMYEVGLNYFFHKNLQLNVEYARVNDRRLTTNHNYNFVDVQFDFRF